MATTNTQDRINQAAWSSRSGRKGFAVASGWTDSGEAAALAWVTQQVQHQPVLDVGVGGGRTVALLTAVSDDYTAVDYTPELVAICRHNHPGIRVQQMDARDMSAFPDESFALVVFSYNGIDAVDYPGRRAILREFSRVLKPGGLVLFSAHNLDGPSYREKPLHLLRMPELSVNPISTCIDVARVAYSLTMGTLNYVRYSPLNREFDGYAIRVCAAHEFGIVIMYTDMDTQCRQLDEVGLHTEAVFGSSAGKRLQKGDDLTNDSWFHFVARKIPIQ
ncbi:SAM-dependent methyltransferase [Paraburkholderia ginsengiterrae]|uniref:SAM-dependent methyltransferase n=1 Tax=Paraburkholderia ginsengiterrae TaxID=1462993 RepID=A0A1A9NG52_9BURK|nr:class I SAM-dependent methyltransferase [Paraburkholderia ginsengiterrae]OAJ62150.1 SAM-dependent methyltransferase [Paraburkholderia ginsengiterrae]OAJ65487.1 SAM-dependent methyltransferase [Paraburkholderia ginsengiterrae]